MYVGSLLIYFNREMIQKVYQHFEKKSFYQMKLDSKSDLIQNHIPTLQIFLLEYKMKPFSRVYLV